MRAVDQLVGVALLLCALPLGLFLASGLLPARSVVARAGTATLAGIGAIAGVAHALLCLGVPGKIAVPALAALGAAACAWRLLRRRAAPEAAAPPTRPVARLVLEAGLLLLVAALLLVKIAIAREFAITENDAVLIWAPKSVRAWSEAPPVLDDPGHWHPEYPRGLALVVATVASPWDELDGRTPRYVGLALFALLLLAAFDALSSRGKTAAGFAVVVILGCLPTVLRQVATGQADVPLSAFVLLACIGLAPQRGGLPAALVALSGAFGALVTKDEGLVFWGVAVLVLAVRLARGGHRRAAIATVVSTVLLAAPWLLLRSRAPGQDSLLLGAWWQNAGFLLMRTDLAIREVAHLAFALPAPPPDSFPFVLPDVVAGADRAVWTAAACGLVLVAGRGGAFPVLPVGILFLSYLGVVVFTAVGIEWQMVTAYGRLVIHGLPLLVVAAADKLMGPDAAETAEARAAAAA
jgi:hypothetical protein